MREGNVIDASRSNGKMVYSPGNVGHKQDVLQQILEQQQQVKESLEAIKKHLGVSDIK